MPLRSLRSGVIDHVPWLVSIWLVDSARRMGEPRTPLAANDHCRSGGHRQCRPSAVMQRAGARHSPQGSKMAGSILMRVSSSLGGAQSPGKPLLYRFAEGEAISILTRLHGRRSFTLQRQTAVQLHRSSAALRSVGRRSRERVSRGEASNGETRRASSTEQRSKDDFWGEARWPGDS